MDTTETTEGTAEEVLTEDQDEISNEIPARETTDTAETDEDGDTFSRGYVEKLRAENAKLRVRAQGADELQHRLHAELVRATGRLADPADLEFDPVHLEDGESLTAAVDSLLESKPHLRSRTPKGDVGQGYRQAAPEPVSWLGLLKNT